MPKPSYLQNISWKLVTLTLLGCYLAPALLVGVFLAQAPATGVTPGPWQAIASFGALLCFLLPPLAAGYVAARFAPQLPRLHVIVVGALGGLVSLLAFRASPRAMVAYAVASLALAAVGGFIRLRSSKQRD